MNRKASLGSRVRSTFIIVPLALIFIFIENPTIIIPIYILSAIILAKELYGLALPDIDSVNSSEISNNNRERRLLNRKIGFIFIILGAFCTAIQVTGQIGYIDVNQLILGFMVMEFLVLSFISIFLAKNFSHFFHDKQVHLFLFFYINFIFFHYLKLKYFFVNSSLQSLASFYLFLAFVISWVFDTTAYLFGRKWGNKKIGLLVSPQKSWVGLISGFLSSFLAGTWVSFILNKFDPMLWEKSFFSEPYWPWVVYPVLGLVAQWGDLIASLHKRSSGVKDSGDLIKGHGGFYDRNDSIILVVVFLYYFVYFYHH